MPPPPPGLLEDPQIQPKSSNADHPLVLPESTVSALVPNTKSELPKGSGRLKQALFSRIESQYSGLLTQTDGTRAGLGSLPSIRSTMRPAILTGNSQWKKYREVSI